MITKLQVVQEYINYGIKEGYFDESDFENLTDQEIIDKATYLMEQGDAYADQLRKGE